MGFGPETLDDKAQKLEHHQKMAALKVKYSGGSVDIVGAAELLIKGDVAVSAAYPAEAPELRKRLQYFKKQGAEDASSARTLKDNSEAGTASSVSASSAKALVDKPAEPPDCVITLTQPDKTASGSQQLTTDSATSAFPTRGKPDPEGGCWQGCFAWFQ